MGVSQGELHVIKAMQDAQNLANEQSVANVITFKRYFGPKMDALRGQSVMHRVVPHFCRGF